MTLDFQNIISFCLSNTTHKHPWGYTVDTSGLKAVLYKKPKLYCYTHDMSVNNESTFLPDFSSPKMVLVIFLLAELLAFLLTLAVDVSEFGFLSEFGIRSLFSLWIAFISSSALYLLKRVFNKGKHWVSGLLAFVTIQLVTLLVCWIVIDELPAKGFLPISVNDADKSIFYWRMLGISSLVSLAFLRYLYILFKWKQQVQAQAGAKLNALQARMRPHFLFNSLNSIASLTRIEPEVAEKLVEDLAELIRASMKLDQTLLVRFEDEVKLVKLYLAIEHHRLEQRLKVAWNIDEIPQDALIPPLSLQPIVENAVYYGVEPSLKGAEILIKGHKTITGITLIVRNTCPEQLQSPQRKGNQLAMENLSARIAGCFAGDGRVVVRSTPDFYQVNIEIPYRIKA